MSYLLRFQQIYPQLSPEKGKTLKEISIKSFARGEQISILEKRRVMNELLTRYPDKVRRVYTGGRSASLWFSIPEEGERGFDIKEAYDTIKDFHPSTEPFSYFDDFNESESRKKTKRLLEVFEHYYIKENPAMNPVSIRGLAGTVEALNDLYLSFKSILDKLREDEHNVNPYTNKKTNH